ncbi:MAG: lipopolysaccharide heptosyltransferase I [Desulfuromonadales bacterium]
MKILVVKVSALGDVVHALPVLPYIKSVAPAAEIDWLVEEAFAPLLEGHPLLRNVHRLQTKLWRKSGVAAMLRGVREIGRLLRRERYDLVLDLQGNSKSALLTLLSRAPLRYGFDRAAVREWPNLVASNRRVALNESDYHISDRSLRIARAALPGGDAVPAAGPLPVSPAAAASIAAELERSGLAGQPLAVLHYGTTWKTKLWPLENWRQLTRFLLRETDLRPILTWGNDEERRAAEAMVEASGGKATIWPRGTLPELLALLARADLVVGGDTGPVHMAAALGIPTVSLYRVTDARRNGPRGEKHIRLQSPLDCSPCLRKGCERDAECGRSIAVEEVFRAIGARWRKEADE